MDAITNDDLPSLLLVDDDVTFCRVVSNALIKRGYNVRIAHSADQALLSAQADAPELVLLDLNMPGDSGLALIPKLKALDNETRIVVLTGYASVATAVEAIKLGATHYLPKPADADEIVQAFERKAGDSNLSVGITLRSVERVEWEHIQKVLVENNGNISATARLLKMHRRTLQRKLAKRPVKE